MSAPSEREAIKVLSRNISDKIARTLMKWTGDTVGEGLEEVFTDLVGKGGWEAEHDP